MMIPGRPDNRQGFFIAEAVLWTSYLLMILLFSNFIFRTYKGKLQDIYVKTASFLTLGETQ